ncbi:MAG: prolipoprotein diacylglyceryl transferase family protein [Mycobacterium leprae]
MTRLGVTIGSITFTWLGLSLGIAVLAGLIVFLRLCRRRGLPESFAFNLALSGLAGGLLGGWAVHVALQWNSFFAYNYALIWKVVPGALSIHGAIICGSLTAAAYSRIQRIGFYAYADLIVPGLSVGIVIGHIGHYFGSAMQGRVAAGFGVYHPVALYSAATGLLLLGGWYLTTRRYPLAVAGTHFWAFAASYGVLRAITDLFRAQPLYVVASVNSEWGIGFFTLPQLLAPLLLVVAVLQLYHLNRARQTSNLEGSGRREAV